MAIEGKAVQLLFVYLVDSFFKNKLGQALANSVASIISPDRNSGEPPGQVSKVRTKRYVAVCPFLSGNFCFCLLLFVIDPCEKRRKGIR